MSNDGTWQPPQQGGTTPPPPSRPQPVPAPPAPPAFGPPPAMPGPAGPGAPLGPEAPLTPAGGAAPSGSKGKLIAVVVGALVLVAAGIFAITRLGGGGSSAGGADSPEAAGQAVLDAVGDEDVLGMIDVLLPGERETLRGPISDLANELTRLEVLSDDASLSDIGGVDVVLSNTAVDVEPTNADDIVNLRMHGDVSVAVDGEALPIGDIVDDNVPEADPAEATIEATEPVAFEVPITAVRKDGRWYVSLFYSVAETARAEAGFDIPAEPIVPTGGDSPEDAVDAFLAGAEALDLRAIVASLNPNEFEALQRYGPAFLDDAQQEIDTAGVELTLDEADYDVQGEGDRRSVAVTYLGGAIIADGETVPFEYEDGCVHATSPDGTETIDSCSLEDSAATDVFGADAEAVADLMATIEAAMADYENPGVIVQQVDGTWYVSPMATSAEQTLAFLRALDREEIESISGEIAELFDDIDGRPVQRRPRDPERDPRGHRRRALGGHRAGGDDPGADRPRRHDRRGGRAGADVPARPLDARLQRRRRVLRGPDGRRRHRLLRGPDRHRRAGPERGADLPAGSAVRARRPLLERRAVLAGGRRVHRRHLDRRAVLPGPRRRRDGGRVRPPARAQPPRVPRGSQLVRRRRRRRLLRSALRVRLRLTGSAGRRPATT